MDKKYTAVDLFAGAGGLSYGFEQSGIDVKLAVEKDAWAVDTYKENHLNKNVLEGDITQMDESIFEEYKGSIDIVMGGPPCQGFSIAASNRRIKHDERNKLYKEFLRVVSIIEPKIVLIENVKEIIRYKLPDGTKIVDDIVSFLESRGYKSDFRNLNCRNYGIPQDRKRFFLVAIRTEKNIEINIEQYMARYLMPEITFNEAISDLPRVVPKEFSEDTILNYNSDPENIYQKKMRAGSTEIHNHIPMRHTQKTISKFEYLLKNSGDLPEELLPRVRSHVDEVSYAKYSQNHRIINGTKVSPTITASFYSSFIHPNQPRNITVREAARIQTFPDTFVFKGKKTTLSKKLLARKGIVEELHLDQFNQVGNAVPPLMAEHLADYCKYLIEVTE